MVYNHNQLLVSIIVEMLFLNNAEISAAPNWATFQWRPSRRGAWVPETRGQYQLSVCWPHMQTHNLSLLGGNSVSIIGFAAELLPDLFSHFPLSWPATT